MICSFLCGSRVRDKFARAAAVMLNAGQLQFQPECAAM
jgi:hypothetical protein